MIRVAIVGSRKYTPWQHVSSLVRHRLPIACTVVTGGAEGVDTWAENAARKRPDFPEPKIFLPDFEAHGFSAYYRRNNQIVAFADVLIAFWDGQSRGTWYTVKRAWKKWPDLHRTWVIVPPMYRYWAPAIQLCLQQYADYGLPERKVLTDGR